LHFSPSLFSVRRAFWLLGAPALSPGGAGSELLARAETKFQSVFVPAEHSPPRAALRQPLASPAPSGEERKELGQFVA